MVNKYHHQPKLKNQKKNKITWNGENQLDYAQSKI